MTETRNSIEARVDSAQLIELMRTAPFVLFQNMRIALRRTMGRFRATFLSRSPVIKKDGANTRSPSAAAARGKAGLGETFRWVVTGNTLETLKARFWTESYVAHGFEVGHDQVAQGGRYMAIPIGISLGKGGRRRRNRTLIRDLEDEYGPNSVHMVKRRGDSWMVYVERKQGRRRSFASGSFSRIGAENRGKVLEPAYLLVKRVHLRQQLNMFPEWQAFTPERDRRIALAVDATLRGERLK